MLEFIEGGHIYLNDGVIIETSVSQLVRFAIGDGYVGVPNRIMKKAGQRGTNIHKAIEDYENGIDPVFENEVIESAFEDYKILKHEYQIKIKSMEQPIIYKDLYCGKYDMLDDNNVLWDFKTTYKLNREWLSWQLGYYYLALEDMGITKFKDVGMVMWLPRQAKARIEDIEVQSKSTLLRNLEKYEIKKKQSHGHIESS